MQIQKTLVQVLFQIQGGFHGIQGFIALILGWLLHILEEGVATALFLPLQEILSTLGLLVYQFEEVAHVLQSHIIMVKIEAQREVGVGGLKIYVDQMVDKSLHLDIIILMNLGAHG